MKGSPRRNKEINKMTVGSILPSTTLGFKVNERKDCETKSPDRQHKQLRVLADGLRKVTSGFDTSYYVSIY